MSEQTEPEHTPPLPHEGAFEGVETRRLRAALGKKLFGEKIPDAPLQLGRFVVVRRLGEGAMGIVYLAYDPQLDRSVALKVIVKAHATSSADRMLRESRALARLSHPHVVGVFDVGAVGPQLFVAMEYVPGATLRGWMREHPCTDRAALEAILGVFAQAADGLSAAHAAGIVHRDFKPDNVLVREDGVVKVADFGLAGPVGLPGETVPSASDASASPGSTDSSRSDRGPSTWRSGSGPRLTETGDVVGTPAYMAPEQIGGHAVDHRADQYAFCIALFEALYGHRPTPRELEGNGTLPAGPVPEWLHRVVLRGLARDPASRHPSMQSLRAALRDDPRARTKRRLVGLGAVTLLVGTAGASYLGGKQQVELADPCAGAARGLEGVWDDHEREQLHTRLAATRVAYAHTVADAVRDVLDAYARAWTAARRDNCEATRVRAEQSDLVFDLREACYRERRRELVALVQVLGESEPAVVERAVEAASKLRGLDTCADGDALARNDPPEALRAVIEDVRERLARVRALQVAGRFTDALALAQQASTDAMATDHPPTIAAARAAVGDGLLDTGQYEEAIGALEDAFWSSYEAGESALGATTAVSLVEAVGARSRKPDEAQRWVRSARASLQRAPEAALAWRLEAVLGEIASQRAELDLALEHQRRALELLRSSDFVPPVDEARMLSLIGGTLHRKGERAQALEHLERAVATLRATVGPEHPSTARTESNLGLMLHHAGRSGEARPMLERAVAVLRAAHGETHDDFGRTLGGFALVLAATGDLEGAAAHMQESAELFERAFGPEHPMAITALEGLARLRLRSGALEEAREIGERTAALRRETNADGAHLAESLALLGEVALLQRRFTDARALLDEAFARRTESLGTESVWVSNDHGRLARLHLGLGDLALALHHAERSVALREAAHGPDDAQLAPFVATLGDVLRAMGHGEAEAAYRRAATLAESGEPDTVSLAKARAGLGWLAYARDELDLAHAHATAAHDGVADQPAAAAHVEADALRLLAAVATRRGQTADARELEARAEARAKLD